MTDTMTKAELLTHIQQSWDDFHRYLKTLSEEQMTIPADAAGWTVKDHVMHLAAWEDGANALLRGQSRRVQMNVDEETWLTQDFDKINAVIYEQHRAKSLAEVMQTFSAIHERLLEKLNTLSDEDIYRPLSFYQPHVTEERPIIVWIKAGTYEHYLEHQPWITAIVE